MNGRYIFFKGVIDTLDLYTDEFVKIYTQHQDECLVLDAGCMDEEIVRLKAFLLEPVTAVISFNNIGMQLAFSEGVNVWDQYGVPFYNILMDHPFHYKEMLEQAPQQAVLLCMDENHAAYVRRFFPNIKRTEFFPHAGIEAAADGDFAYLPLAERKIDVLYAGGLSRYAAEGLIPDLGKIVDFDAFVLVKNALERLIQEPDYTTEFVIEQCLKDLNFTFDNQKLGEIVAKLRFVDAFAVSFYREQMVRMLVESGVTVTVFGTGWNRCEWEHPNLVYGGGIPPYQILELMRQSRIVLNTMTWFKRGAHDRIFNGMLAGAAVVSDTSAYLEECFTSGRELQMFSLKDMRGLVDSVRDLLTDPKRAQNMADCGYQAARDKHRWINRLRDIHLL